MRGITIEVTERSGNMRLHALTGECSMAAVVRKRRISSVSSDLLRVCCRCRAKDCKRERGGPGQQPRPLESKS